MLLSFFEVSSIFFVSLKFVYIQGHDILSLNWRLDSSLVLKRLGQQILHVIVFWVLGHFPFPRLSTSLYRTLPWVFFILEVF